MKRPVTWFAAALCAALLHPNVAGADETVKPVFAGALPNVPGNNLSAVLVTYKPGERSATHHHAGSVFAYVLSGAIRSQVSGDAEPKVYKAGESFFEPPGSDHLVSENASDTEPASLLAVIVAEDGATLTEAGKRN
jgi:quercetin dioxygenase-like cupin family protein